MFSGLCYRVPPESRYLQQQPILENTKLCPSLNATNFIFHGILIFLFSYEELPGYLE
jgi:hypothetical protein